MNLSLLTTLTFLPLAGAILILLIGSGDEETAARNAKRTALWTSLVTLAVSLVVLSNFDWNQPGFQMVEESSWLSGIVKYRMGIDGISLGLILLTTLLMPICILMSWTAIKERVKDFMVAFLILETLVLGVFCALDMVLFYLFFEGSLIPMFLIIGVWGGQRRIYATYKFFLYTLAGSVLMLIAMIIMIAEAGSADIRVLLAHDFPAGMQIWLWLAFFASFAVKMPFFPVHTWLPAAHVEAPTSGSIILAGILLKLGGYGFLRFSLPMFPDASVALAPLVQWICVIAVIYGSIIAFVQDDIKKLVAYSSVAHMGVVGLGLFSGNIEGVQGAYFLMISHGLISGALFACIGVIYERAHTRGIMAFGGVVKVMPLFAVMMMLFTMANIGLPGTAGFVGEFLALAGSFKSVSTMTAVAALGMILSAIYGLWLYRKVVSGDVTNDLVLGLKDMNGREIAALAPLAILTIILGFYPSLLLDLSQLSVSTMIAPMEEVLANMHKASAIVSQGAAQ